MAEQVTLEGFFGAVISTYTAGQAVDDGALVDVTETAREAGFACRVVVTRNVWEQCVCVPEGCEGMQDERGRLWDVVHMARLAAKAAPPGETFVKVKLHVVSEARHLTRTPPTVELWAISDGGDEGRQLITIMFPEDY